MIRLCKMYNLIFFVLISLYSCGNKNATEISIVWSKEQATGVTIPTKLLNAVSPDSVKQTLKIELNGANHTAILGEFSISGQHVIFEPLIPFSRGLRYVIFLRNKPIGEIEIPLANPAGAPTLLSIYPSRDTLPENLLKIYLQFSNPMQEGQSEKYIVLVKNSQDTLHGIFLNLQPELWNEDRTTLTVWLDPGRIKRDLIPNKRLGNPLKKGELYKLGISSEWKDIQGRQLKQAYIKTFFVGSRDSISPDPDKWILKIPRSGAMVPLQIDLNEPLDYFLLKEAISIINEKGNSVPGMVRISDEEKKYQFIPAERWSAGNYTLRVETRLEDLAGNNINRVFDRDLTDKRIPGSKAIFERQFQIK